MCLNGLLQYYYLKKHDASFSEHFYGLKRATRNTLTPLSEKQRQVSLLVLTLLPYLKRKLEEKINIYKLQRAEGSLRNVRTFSHTITLKTKQMMVFQNLQGDLRRLLVHLHTLSHLSWGVWTVINYLRYMSNKTNAQLPILEIINLQYVYSVEVEDLNFWSSFSLSNGLRTTLEISAFFMQFLQVWNAEKPNFNLAALPVVEPPNVRSFANIKGDLNVCIF